jgi:16S rRNA (guanine966-N2)-methyltransferase
VRIIGGRWRRTPLPVPDVPGLRPTPDRVRETLFNWLAHLLPQTAALRGLDLFAGSGALGFELASRGAQRVVLVERHPALVAALRAVKARLAAEAVEIVAGDALRVAAQLPDASFDIVFLDPPFAADLLPAAITAGRRLLAPGGLIYAEGARALAADRLAALGMQQVRNGRAGQVHFCLLRRGDA